MEWELRHVEDVEAVLDDSGVYVVVHRVEQTETHKGYAGIRVSVRADLMHIRPDKNHEPVVSFQGSANTVRKALIRYLTGGLIAGGEPFGDISLEHASYIGYELLRAELTPGYVQD